MLCPSDTRAPEVWDCYARTNYVANTGAGLLRKEIPARHLVGPFCQNSGTRLSGITHGASTTACVSEVITVTERPDLRGVWAYAEGPHYQHDVTPNTSVPDEIRVGMCYSVTDAPCVGTYSNHATRAVRMTARSQHPGGVNLLLMDGSVHFVNESIDAHTWHFLGIHNDGNPIGNF